MSKTMVRFDHPLFHDKLPYVLLHLSPEHALQVQHVGLDKHVVMAT